MKILFIAPQPFMEERGTPLAVLQLLKALSNLGHEVDLLTYHVGSAINLRGIKHHRSLKIPLITRIKKGMSAVKLFLDIFVFCKMLQLLLTRRYDCIHAVEEGAIMAAILKKAFRLPLVYDMDSSIPEQLQASGSRLWGRPLVVGLAEALEHWTVRSSDVVLAVCQSLRERVLTSGNRTPVLLLEDIPNVEPYNPIMADRLGMLRRELGLTDQQVVLYTGTFESYQGIDLLLATIKLVVPTWPTVRFILVGGDATQVAATSIEVQRLGIGNSVTILGKRSMDDMPLFLEMADILVSPRNLGTNTPMKIYSYLQSGRPIVATRLLTHTQVLDDSVALLVEPEPTAFAAGLVKLLADGSLRTCLGQAGKQLVKNQFSFSSFQRKVEEAYSLINVR